MKNCPGVSPYCRPFDNPDPNASEQWSETKRSRVRYQQSNSVYLMFGRRCNKSVTLAKLLVGNGIFFATY